MPNEEIVLRPKRWGILAAWLSFPWAMAIGIPMLILADRTKEMKMRVEYMGIGWLVGFFFAFLVSCFLVWYFCAKKITLKPNGEIHLDQRIISEKEYHVQDGTIRLYRRHSLAHLKERYYTKDGVRYRVEKWVLPVLMHDMIHAKDIAKFGYMQQVLPRRKPEGTEKWFPTHQIAFVSPEKRGKVWNLYCFRMQEIYMLLDFIQRKNNKAKYIE